MGQRRPYVHLNLAVDSGAAVAGSNAAPMSISCAADWRRVHMLREACDAIAVGANTWLGDRPRLTARADHLGRAPRRQPEVVIFGGSKACEAAHGKRRTFVVTSQPASAGTLRISAHGRDLREPLALLLDYGVRSLLVEGGPTLLRSFLDQGLVDRLTVYVRADSPEEGRRIARRVLPWIRDEHAHSFGGGVLVSSEPGGGGRTAPDRGFEDAAAERAPLTGATGP